MRKSKIIRNIVIILFIIFFAVGLVYVFLGRNEKANVVLISDMKNEIKIVDSFPMVDKVGKNIKYDQDNSKVQGYYEFEVLNKSDKKTKFEIYASDFDYENTIHSNFIKMYLTDNKNNPMPGFDGLAVPTYYNLPIAKLTPTGSRLYYGTLKANESKKFILRAWVGDAYAVSQSTSDFGFKIYVEAE